ncbi:MAG: hypothetical protein ACD_72C00363G0001 [uncultured bacterium]|nr:MAG: hypothetical protein ACD_72C00363G0001 [uncultured bacterium]
MMNIMKWTKTMYRLFAFMILQDVFSSCDSWNPFEAQIIEDQINKYKTCLSSHQLNLIKFRVRKAKNNYKINLLENFQSQYWREIDRGEEMYPSIDYDQQIYDTWTKGVRLRKSVKMQYESITAGITTRIVDPYRTKAPYGIGYCHTNHEERKFRFDRIIEISLTNNSFVKPIKPKQNLWKTEIF